MTAATFVPVEEYLRTSYEPDREYVEAAARHVPLVRASGGGKTQRQRSRRLACSASRRNPRLEAMRRDGKLKHDFPDYAERLDREIRMLQQMKFSGYFLFVICGARTCDSRFSRNSGCCFESALKVRDTAFRTCA